MPLSAPKQIKKADHKGLLRDYGLDSRANVSLRLGHLRGKTILNRFLTPSGRYATHVSQSPGKLVPRKSFLHGSPSSPSIRQNKKQTTRVCFLFWSGLRGSNPPPPPWQGGALPNELNPRKWCLRSESNQRHGDFQSPALPTELQRHTEWRLGWGSNPRPLA